MNTNKIIIIFSILVIMLLLFIPTTYKVIKNHNNNLTQVVENKIIEAVKKCYYEDNCKNEKVTLRELYELNYLEPISNPISKEFYNEDSYVEIKDNNFNFIIKE